MCRWLGALLTPPPPPPPPPTPPPIEVFFFHQRAKNCPSMTKISRGQDTHYLRVCTKSEASIWFWRPLMQINNFDLFLAVKYVQRFWLEWNFNLTCSTTYCMYILSFKLISKKIEKKPGIHNSQFTISLLSPNIQVNDTQCKYKNNILLTYSYIYFNDKPILWEQRELEILLDLWAPCLIHFISFISTRVQGVQGCNSDNTVLTQ